MVLILVTGDESKINGFQSEVSNKGVLSHNRRYLVEDPIKYQIKICGTKPDVGTEGTTTPETTTTAATPPPETTTTVGTTPPEASTTDDEILISTSEGTKTTDEEETPTEEEEKEKDNKRILTEEIDFNMTNKVQLANIVTSILKDIYGKDVVTTLKVEIPEIEEPYSLIINITLEVYDIRKIDVINNLNLEISSNNNELFYKNLNNKTDNIYNKCQLPETTTCKYSKQFYKYITSDSKTTSIQPIKGSKPIEGSCTNKVTKIDSKTGKITISLSKELDQSLCRIKCRDYLKNDGYGVVSIKIIDDGDVNTNPEFDKIIYPIMIYVNQPFNTTLTLKYPDIITDVDSEEEIDKKDNKKIDNEELTIEMVVNEDSNFTINDQEATDTTEFKYINANITVKENNIFTLDKDDIELIFRNDSNYYLFYKVKVTILSQPCPDPDEMGVCCVHQKGELCSNLTVSFSFISFTQSRLLPVGDNDKNIEFRQSFKNVLDENVFKPQHCVSTDTSKGTALEDPLILSIKKLPPTSDDTKSDSPVNNNKPTITLEEAFKDIISSIEKIQNNEIPEVATLLVENNIILDPEKPISYSQVIDNTELPTVETTNPTEPSSNWAKDNWYVILIIVVVVLVLIIGSVFGTFYYIKRKDNSKSNLPTNFKSINKKYEVNDKQVDENHQSIEDIEPVGDNVVGKISIDINNNNSSGKYTSNDDDDDEENGKVINKKIKYEGYLEKEMPGRTTDPWILRYCVLYENPLVLYVYESMKLSYKGNLYTGVKQIIPLDSIKNIEYDKKNTQQNYDFIIIIQDNDQQVQSNECMEDLKYVHFRIPTADYNTTVNSFNEWINYLNCEDTKPSLIKDAWGGDDDNFVSDKEEDAEEEDDGNVKIDFNYDDQPQQEQQYEDEQQHQQQSPPPSPPHRQTPPPPPQRNLPPSPSSPIEQPEQEANSPSSPLKPLDKPSLPIGRVKAHRDIGLRDEV